MLQRFLSAAFLAIALASGQTVDNDRDGLDDALEQKLLEQFQPRFHISADDCSVAPAQFQAGQDQPTAIPGAVAIYGQAFKAGDAVELHYHHLWPKDCGRGGHDLDAEHVSVLLRRDGDTWRAAYWYGAAHENTPCDASSAARASIIDAESTGARVWISHGKHASFLAETSCTTSTGCGADNCTRYKPLAAQTIINIGERDRPLNGAIWTASPRWPLAAKMGSDFPPSLTSTLEHSQSKGPIYVNPVLRPAQAVFLGGNLTYGAMETGAIETTEALDHSATQFNNALTLSVRKTRDGIKRGATWLFRRKPL